MSRGGTNLLWNIVQSHPDVIDSYYELNEIFGGKTEVGLFNKARIELEALGHIPCYGVARIARQRLHYYANMSFHQDRFNREKFPGVEYPEQDLRSLIICTKLVSAWEVDPSSHSARSTRRSVRCARRLPTCPRVSAETRCKSWSRHSLSQIAR